MSTSLGIACPACGAHIAAMRSVCGECGTPLMTYSPESGPVQALVAQLPKAPLGARFAALVIDLIVQLAAVIPGGLIVFAATSTQSGGKSLVGTGVIAMLLGWAWGMWYAFVKDGNSLGAGIGKRRMGLMVVHLPSGLPATRGQSALRALVMMLTNLLPFVGILIEPILALVSEKGRRLGDMAADTQVVSTEDYALTLV